MKTPIKLLLLGTVLVFYGPIIDAQTIIYSNTFNGIAVTVNGSGPTTANSLLGGSGTAKWICTTTNGVNNTINTSGTIDTNPGCALLPFTPQPGCVYFMKASLTIPMGMPNWVAMGFTQLAAQTNNATGNYCRFTDNPPAGYAWMVIKANSAQGVFGGRGTGWSLGNTTIIPAGTTNLTIVLNTVGLHWTMSAYLGGTITGTNVIGGAKMGTNFTYGANPPIAYAGIGQTSFAGQSVAGIHWDYWTLYVTQVLTSPTTNTYWMGPSASGTGDGSSSANAASYLDSGFWIGVQSQLQVADVNINLMNGDYNAGTLNLNDMGNPLHRLTLQAVNPSGPVFDSTGNTIISILGSQNIKFDGVLFTGPVQYWGVNCQPDNLASCRNLQFSHCQFINLTNVVYGAIGLLNGVRDVLVNNCTFTNLSAQNGNHQHMIYASHNIMGVTVTNCLFQDCLADYVRFRDDSEYCMVQNCRFVSTMSASAWPFISAELFNETNSDSAGDEFFGTHFQISSNSFTYNVSGGPGPYSAFHFSDNGFSPKSYDCDLTSAQATQLANGTTSFQRSFLQTNMGIIASGIKMFGNTYNSRVAHAVDYTYNWDGTQPNGGWSGTVDISGVPDSSGAPLEQVPMLRNGNFDWQGLQLTPISQGLKNWECLFRTWICAPKYTGILRNSGFDGTANALRFDQTQNQCVYQWITSPGLVWTMGCQFAIGSGFSGTGTKFRVDILHDDISGGKVSVGVNEQGQFGIYNDSGAFMALQQLGTVSLSTNKVYRLRIVGNYAASKPYVNIYTSDANSPLLSHQFLNATDWVSGPPVSGQSSPETVTFNSYTAPVILDQVVFAPGLPGQPPVITSASLNNGQFVLFGTNGFAGDNFYLLSSTNLASGPWTIETTNAFDANGTFFITNTATPAAPQRFYRLELQ